MPNAVVQHQPDIRVRLDEVLCGGGRRLEGALAGGGFAGRDDGCQYKLTDCKSQVDDTCQVPVLGIDAATGRQVSKGLRSRVDRR